MTFKDLKLGMKVIDTHVDRVGEIIGISVSLKKARIKYETKSFQTSTVLVDPEDLKQWHA